MQILFTTTIVLSHEVISHKRVFYMIKNKYNDYMHAHAHVI